MNIRTFYTCTVCMYIHVHSNRAQIHTQQASIYVHFTRAQCACIYACILHVHRHTHGKQVHTCILYVRSIHVYTRAFFTCTDTYTASKYIRAFYTCAVCMYIRVHSTRAQTHTHIGITFLTLTRELTYMVKVCVSEIIRIAFSMGNGSLHRSWKNLFL